MIFIPAELSENGRKVAEQRYLTRASDGVINETVDGMWRRIARAVADIERRYKNNDARRAAFETAFYESMASHRFVPAGRTLANAGAPTPLVPNCIVLHIEDSMDSIFSTLHDAARLQQRGSGLGFPLHMMRPAGSHTRFSNGTASGPISFLRVYDAAFSTIKQQGRHGANMAVMRVDHPDILEFVHCKAREGDIANFNISVGMTREFMKQVRQKSDEPWYCHFEGVKMLPRRIVRSKDGHFERAEEVTMTASQLHSEIMEAAWNNGEPGVLFLDTANDANPLPGLGRIEATNPCGK